jgi:ABC-type sulfate/molybdate transport systems ATPase subunit
VTALSIERLRNHALAGIDLEVGEGELLALVGPSGAGKSTLLHAVAGLVPYTGTVRFDGRSVDRLQAFERRVGVVFQDLFLFPHLTARANVRIAMKHLCLPAKAEADRIRDLLARFRLDSLADRRPSDLSGGEKQRVALARAVATSPRLLLLDEPLSSLDEDTARGLRREISRFQRDLSITTVLVTHDLREAAELGDRIVELRRGALVRATSSATGVGRAAQETRDKP